MKPIYKNLIILFAFSIAMGFLETAVVVYLRELYFPRGFHFPVIPMRKIILITELGRELATIIMLITIGILSGKNFAQRFTFFLFSFAVWDIFYYIFLKVLLNWPSLLLDWDVLFLLPVPWFGPVLAPCLISLSMILFTLLVVRLNSQNIHVVFKFYDWIWMIAGSLVLIASFIKDYLVLLTSSDMSAESLKMLANIRHFIPENYNWWIFIIGELMILGAIFHLYFRSKKANIPEENIKSEILPNDKSSSKLYHQKFLFLLNFLLILIFIKKM